VFKFLNYFDESNNELNEERKKRCELEGEILKELNEMGDMKVPQFLDLIHIEERGLVALVMEKLSGTTLDRLFGHKKTASIPETIEVS